MRKQCSFPFNRSLALSVTSKKIQPEFTIKTSRLAMLRRRRRRKRKERIISLSSAVKKMVMIGMMRTKLPLNSRSQMKNARSLNRPSLMIRVVQIVKVVRRAIGIFMLMMTVISHSTMLMELLWQVLAIVKNQRLSLHGLLRNRKIPTCGWRKKTRRSRSLRATTAVCTRTKKSTT